MCLALIATTTAAAPPGVRVDVTAGRVPVTDWIVEQQLDLPAAARLLEHDGDIAAKDIAVLELDAQGVALGPRTCQIDKASMPGRFIVNWRMPGPTRAGQTRRFLITFDGKRESPGHDTPISATAEGDTITIVNGPIVLQHARDAGGMIRHVKVGSVEGSIKWTDQVWGDWYWKGTHKYRLADHRAESVKIVAAGPLRVVVEARSEYLAGAQRAASRPRAMHRFTTYAGQPVTHVRATARQDFQKQWFYLHRMRIDLSKAGLGKPVQDTTAGKWVAAFNNDLLVGIAAGSKPTANLGPLFAGEPGARWTTLANSWQATLFWGAGEKDLGLLKTWSAIAASSPSITIHFEPLAARIEAAKAAVGARQADPGMFAGERWAQLHARNVMARAHLTDAASTSAAGAFGDAEQALEMAEAALRSRRGDANLASEDGVVAGLVDGHPYLGNDKVAYVWSHVKDGAGLLSIYDRSIGREYLKVTPAASSLWRIAVKNGQGGKSYANEDAPCIVTPHPRGLSFKWESATAVQMLATLDPDESVVRLRLSAEAHAEDEGLQTVMFPLLDGIRPLTPGGAGDVVLDSQATGSRHPSPLISGDNVWSPYPHGMQFNALYGDGRGLYVAEHDPEARVKDLTWSPQKQTETLNFTITHALGGWAGPELIKDYESPGDVVIGPFDGEWFDAALLYREWALTAPWCAKGPIHARTDYPQWLAQAPYWTIGGLSNERSVQTQVDIAQTFGLPIGVCHAYGWWFQPHQDDGYPDYFPPRLGSDGLRRSIQSLQRSGMRVVPYVNGLLWDKDTESWRADDAQKGAIKGPEGQVLVLKFSGNKHVAMCPASKLWRRKSADFTKELLGRYGVDGVYYDFLTAQFGDCYDPDHGHIICGGDFWVKSAREYYGQMRRHIKKINPNAIVTGEHNAEWIIDILDTQLTMSDERGPGLPMFQAVYHGYTLLYGLPGNRGPYRGDLEPQTVGRWWLAGNQNGWYGQAPIVVRAMRGNPDAQKWLPHAKNYLNLLHCHHHFARPYLAYGQMLRPPHIDGSLPAVQIESPRGAWRIPIVDGSAWKAPDGSVGLFFLNYDQQQSHDFTWTVDMREGAGWDADTKVILSKWTTEDGLTRAAEVQGGEMRRQQTIEPWGLIALKLEVGE